MGAFAGKYRRVRRRTGAAEASVRVASLADIEAALQRKEPVNPAKYVMRTRNPVWDLLRRQQRSCGVFGRVQSQSACYVDTGMLVISHAGAGLCSGTLPRDLSRKHGPFSGFS